MHQASCLKYWAIDPSDLLSSNITVQLSSLTIRIYFSNPDNWRYDRLSINYRHKMHEFVEAVYNNIICAVVSHSVILQIKYIIPIRYRQASDC